MSCSSVFCFFFQSLFWFVIFCFFFFLVGDFKKGETLFCILLELWVLFRPGCIVMRNQHTLYLTPPNTLLIAQTHLQRNRGAWHARVTRNGWELAPQLSCSGFCLAPPCTKIKPPATTSSPAEAPALHPSISNACARSALLFYCFPLTLVL